MRKGIFVNALSYLVDFLHGNESEVRGYGLFLLLVRIEDPGNSPASRNFKNPNTTNKSALIIESMKTSPNMLMNSEFEVIITTNQSSIGTL